MKISVYNNRKLQNYCKKYKIHIHEDKELINVYGSKWRYRITDKWINVDSQSEHWDNVLILGEMKLNYELQFEQEFEKKYPNAPINTVSEIINTYTDEGYGHGKRKVSKTMIERMDTLVVAYARHNYTNYDNIEIKDSLRGVIRKSFNNDVYKIIEEWK